eukprot:CAMPEP_0181302448 /NCGR_PEP_ID=MMETSP1101-20121128/8006_1 /TAXON_ID=46948 /ORGANISM="Rhodomonas abbreviata, Strain Caron Lab Isolate" /LENGTH=301 /DNA_ID=CAMNT_0023407907 /DNA_START=27 /DNA_END=933 /DNA_ORIENTATION=-
MITPEEVCEALNINQLSLQTEFPIQVVQCVAKHIIIPLRSRRSMSGLDPDMDQISSMCAKYDADSFHLFSLDPMAGGAVHSRNLAPLVLLDEEAASASANAALTAYVHYHRILPISPEETFECEQGFAFSMKPRPSKVMVQLHLESAMEDGAPIPQSAAGQPHGVAAQNEWIGQATGQDLTQDRLMKRGDRYSSNFIDETRFNLPEGYYEEVDRKEREEKKKMDEAKRLGKVYKEEKEDHASTAILPPPPLSLQESRAAGLGAPVSRPSHDMSMWWTIDGTGQLVARLRDASFKDMSTWLG